MPTAGTLEKMRGQLVTGEPVHYALPVGDELLPLNAALGHTIRLQYDGSIFCTHCGRKTNKSFNQGYCYPCFKKLPQCDSCIVSPEKCHYAEGTCRDSAWGDKFCMTEHIVYLANSSGIKVGITRASQIPTRWVDQGAIAAVPFLRVATRQQSGLVEVLFKAFVADKTNWRAMLKGEVSTIDLVEQGRELLALNRSRIGELQNRFGLQAITPLIDEQQAPEVVNIDYPVLEYPKKITSLSFDKTPLIEGMLMGIKGQYLILDTGVVNIRKHTAYHVTVNLD